MQRRPRLVLHAAQGIPVRLVCDHRNGRLAWSDFHLVGAKRARVGGGPKDRFASGIGILARRIHLSGRKDAEAELVRSIGSGPSCGRCECGAARGQLPPLEATRDMPTERTDSTDVPGGWRSVFGRFAPIVEAPEFVAHLRLAVVADAKRLVDRTREIQILRHPCLRSDLDGAIALAVARIDKAPVVDLGVPGNAVVRRITVSDLEDKLPHRSKRHLEIRRSGRRHLDSCPFQGQDARGALTRDHVQRRVEGIEERIDSPRLPVDPEREGMRDSGARSAQVVVIGLDGVPHAFLHGHRRIDPDRPIDAQNEPRHAVEDREVDADAGIARVQGQAHVGRGPGQHVEGFGSRIQDGIPLIAADDVQGPLPLGSQTVDLGDRAATGDQLGIADGIGIA